MHEIIHEYLGRGWHLFPCRPDKTPYTAHGFKDATTDIKQLEAWWQRWPDAWVGIATGPISGIDVVDVDDLDLAPPQLQSKYFVRTPGGAHHYFRATGQGCAVRIVPGVDIRGDGGYVIAPPSPGYEFLGRGAIPELPNIVKSSPVQEIGPGAVEGERNNRLFKYACNLVGKNIGNWQERIFNRNNTYLPPLPISEVQAIINSAKRYNCVKTYALGIQRNNITRVIEASTQWLIKPYLPAGDLVILEGCPGLGKSFLTIYWASLVNSPVLMWNQEDAPGVIKQRALAHNATNIELLNTDGPLLLPQAIPNLRAHIEELGARLLIIDPVISTLGDRSVNNPQEVRAAIEPLRKLAQDTGCTIIMVRHWNKKIDLPLQYRGDGGNALLALTRTANALIKYRESVYLTQIKNNYIRPEDRPPREILWDNAGRVSLGPVGVYSAADLENAERNQT